MPKVDLRPLSEQFRAYLLEGLKKEGLIDANYPVRVQASLGPELVIW